VLSAPSVDEQLESELCDAKAKYARLSESTNKNPWDFAGRLTHLQRLPFTSATECNFKIQDLVNAYIQASHQQEQMQVVIVQSDDPSAVETDINEFSTSTS